MNEFLFFTCKECGESFGSLNGLNTHKRHSKARGECKPKIHVCQYCGRSDFDSRHAMLTHESKSREIGKCFNTDKSKQKSKPKRKKKDPKPPIEIYTKEDVDHWT